MTDSEAPGAWSVEREGDADLVFDLSGSSEPEANTIVPLFDGRIEGVHVDVDDLSHGDRMLNVECSVLNVE